jgi:hypothetical protein
LQREADNAPDLELLDALPVGEVDLARLPDEQAERCSTRFGWSSATTGRPTSPTAR